MPIKIIINYQNLKYFMTTKNLIRYQTYYTGFLSGFNFVISYIQINKAKLLIKK